VSLVTVSNNSYKSGPILITTCNFTYFLLKCDKITETVRVVRMSVTASAMLMHDDEVACQHGISHFDCKFCCFKG